LALAVRTRIDRRPQDMRLGWQLYAFKCNNRHQDEGLGLGLGLGWLFLAFDAPADANYFNALRNWSARLSPLSPPPGALISPPLMTFAGHLTFSPSPFRVLSSQFLVPRPESISIKRKPPLSTNCIRSSRSASLPAISPWLTCGHQKPENPKTKWWP